MFLSFLPHLSLRVSGASHPPAWPLAAIAVHVSRAHTVWLIHLPSMPPPAAGEGHHPDRFYKAHRQRPFLGSLASADCCVTLLAAANQLCILQVKDIILTASTRPTGSNLPWAASSVLNVGRAVWWAGVTLQRANGGWHNRDMISEIWYLKYVSSGLS